MKAKKRKKKSHEPHRSIIQRKVHRAEMVKLFSRGWTQQQIADKFGVNQTQISYDWKIVLKQLRETRDADTQALVDQKLAEYAEVKKEAWAAWEKSKEDVQKRIDEVYSSGDKDKSLVKKIIEGRIPANEYLRTILTCLEAERDLLALNPAKQMEVRGAINWDAYALPDAVPDLIEARVLESLPLENGNEQQNGDAQ